MSILDKVSVFCFFLIIYSVLVAQWAGAVEYTDVFPAEG